ncbi:5-methylcytosine-specific restriction endonuclease McrA [Variovorax paradoxus]|uniref:HNH endonuclease n=1 Tax=Variovorax paradoxus TaxID=34073 RepID=UPI00278D8051|nr:HNH endonuclease [Variovorax paradoxus]MDQ0571477.1 5-methylcytosine-specific restriction endonuclease McrA [Variovorax paradoxus]
MRAIQKGEGRSCSKCDVWKLFSEFGKRANRPSGHKSQCKACEKINAWTLTKAWRDKNQEKYAEKKRAWSRTEKAKASAANWIDRNRDAVYLYNRAKRKLAVGIQAKSIVEHVQKLMKTQKCKCVVCHADISSAYHIDHIVSIKAGGRSEIGNLQLLCQSCNCSKGAKHPVEFMQSRGFLL